MANKMKEVAALLGVEIGEDFKVIGKPDGFYVIYDFGLMRDTAGGARMDNKMLTELLNGKYELVKLKGGKNDG